jgi:Barstar (barnase inhibitor)
MSDFESTLATPQSHVMICIATADELCAYGYRLNYEIGRTYAVRLVRGRKMRSLSDLFDEFAACFQFPCYFGENWSAFDECLADLEWLPAVGYVLLVLNAPDVLREEPPDEFATFTRIINTISDEWLRVHKKVFRVLLQCDERDCDALRRRSGRSFNVARLGELPALL